MPIREYIPRKSVNFLLFAILAFVFAVGNVIPGSENVAWIIFYICLIAFCLRVFRRYRRRVKGHNNHYNIY